MARVVVAGAGAIGASIAYHLALRGADDVVLADVGEIAGGATGKAMGGVRQQFTTEAEVRLAQASVRLFQELGAPLFEQVGYLFLATTPAGLAELEQRRVLQASLGVPVENVDAGYVEGLRIDDVLGATICREDGIADPGGRDPRARAARCRAGRRRARAHRRARPRGGDARRRLRRRLAGGRAARAGSSCPCARSSASSPTSARSTSLPGDLPMTIEENGFHFRRVGADGLRLAMGEPELRWDGPEEVRDDLVEDWRERLALPLSAGGRRAASPRLGRLLRHDPGRAPDHRPGRGRPLRRVRLLRARLHAVAGRR